MKIRFIAIISIFIATSAFLAAQARAQINPNLVISPNPLVFDSVPPGGTSGPETVRVTNQSTSYINLSGAGISDNVNFSITTDRCTISLSPNSYCDVDVSFAPTGQAGGYFSGFAIFDANQEPIAVSVLTGTVAAPVVNLMPTSVDFGNQTVGSSSFPSDVILKNSGNAVMNITSITTSAPFAVTDDCGATLASGARCTISQTFAPTAAGAVSGSVAIITDAQTSPDSIALSGTGVSAGTPDASFSTTELDFGGQVVNTTSAVQTIDMKNTGTVNLNITSITPPTAFAYTDNCGNMLAPNAECAINATFTPTATQLYTGDLVVVTNAEDSPHSIALMGFGSNFDGAQAVLSTTTLDFGEQKLRTPSDPQAITVTNEGSEDLTVQSVEKTADTTGSYSGEEDCSSGAVSPGGTCTINITFNPQEKGTQVATGDITSNSTDSPQQISATGIGVRISGGNCSLTVVGASAGAVALSTILLSLGAMAWRRKRHK
jgi:hypothetical protein